MIRSPKSIVGKTIIGVITRPAGGGHDSIAMLQFSDGSCFELVSRRGRQTLSRMAAGSGAKPHRAESAARTQLSFFPQDGAGQAAAPTAAAA